MADARRRAGAVALKLIIKVMLKAMCPRLEAPREAVARDLGKKPSWLK